MGACLSSSSPPAGAAQRRPRKRSPRGKPADKDGGAAEARAAVEFGYERDFEARYDVGRLLGHGQFGYTFAATERLSGDRVAVKRIDKAKVRPRPSTPGFHTSSLPRPPTAFDEITPHPPPHPPRPLRVKSTRHPG
jgi:serine/threonine protein kinase